MYTTNELIKKERECDNLKKRLNAKSTTNWEDSEDDYVSNIEWTEEDEKKEKERKNREEWKQYWKNVHNAQVQYKKN